MINWLTKIKEKMKAIMIIFNQALSEEVLTLLDDLDIRGFTKFNNLQGRGTELGEPKMGTHTWPALNNSIMCFTAADKAEALLESLKELNASGVDQGLKAFTWDAAMANF